MAMQEDILVLEIPIFGTKHDLFASWSNCCIQNDAVRLGKLWFGAASSVPSV